MSMVYSLVHFPNIDLGQINEFRSKYDPQFQLIQPHITLMFPVSDSVGEETLVDHLRAVLRDRQSFPIHLQGVAKSVDDYLFLLVDEGKDNIADLHARIYMGVLADFRRRDLAYVPHITLGMFANNKTEISQALGEAERLDMNYRCLMDRLELLKINDQRTQILWSREFLLT